MHPPHEARERDGGRLAALSGGRPGQPNNLPLQLSSFVDREKELAVVERLLGDNRLLTLAGSGGCGKSRLALEALELAEGFDDGVWLVELASLSDPDLVPQALAVVLSVSEMPGIPLVDLLLAHLRAREVEEALRYARIDTVLGGRVLSSVIG
jgi:hypothetical protein